jgi:protein O-GlcNAc transferase
VWKRLLHAVPQSLLRLKQPAAGARGNLEREAAARGIDAARLVYAENLPLEDHLARHANAGVFNDTLPYYAHATAADALGAGLPVLTCKGQSFAGRVAASLLDAVGLPELVTDSLDAYEAIALDLARDPAKLQAIREKLARNLATAPLFDSEGFRRDIEEAFIIMHKQGSYQGT